MVTEQDVERIRVQLKPGSVHSAANLFAMYTQLMEADGRPAAHPTTLGHALGRAGFIKYRARRRINGKQRETSSWAVPGARKLVNEESERMGQVLRALGPGIHPNRLIWQEYDRMAREKGWAHGMGERDVARWLTKNNFVRLPEHGGSRFVPPEKIPAA